MKENEKLIRNEEEAIECLKSNKPTSGYVMLQESIDMAIQALKKLEDYEDLEEQGRLVKLPCKAVYFIVDINNPKYAMVTKRSIRELAIYEIEGIDKSGCKYFSTEEKAEAKLKELRGEK